MILILKKMKCYRATGETESTHLVLQHVNQILIRYHMQIYSKREGFKQLPGKFKKTDIMDVKET